MPHFNSVEMLKRMLKSIPEREDIQVIVVDDFSKDESRIKLSELHHKNLEIYYQSSNQGAANARNDFSLFMQG